MRRQVRSDGVQLLLRAVRASRGHVVYDGGPTFFIFTTEHDKARVVAAAAQPLNQRLALPFRQHRRRDGGDVCAAGEAPNAITQATMTAALQVHAKCRCSPEGTHEFSRVDRGYSLGFDGSAKACRFEPDAGVVLLN